MLVSFVGITHDRSFLLGRRPLALGLGVINRSISIRSGLSLHLRSTDLRRMLRRSDFDPHLQIVAQPTEIIHFFFDLALKPGSSLQTDPIPSITRDSRCPPSARRYTMAAGKDVDFDHLG